MALMTSLVVVPLTAAPLSIASLTMTPLLAAPLAISLFLTVTITLASILDDEGDTSYTITILGFYYVGMGFVTQKPNKTNW